VSRAPRPGLGGRTGRAGFIVLTGLSGAGKSQAIRALEDLGYYCVDNLPTALIPVLADLSLRQDADYPKVAVVADIREPGFVTDFPRVWRRLRAKRELGAALVFLEASDATLLRRYSETRRPHPMAPDRPVTEGLQRERKVLATIRLLADDIVDTSDLTVHELRRVFLDLARNRHERARLMMTFESFGYKHGLPLDADLVFDARFLPNPHFVPALRPMTGKDRAVAAYLRRQAETDAFVERLTSFLRYLVPNFVAEGKAYLTVAVGCTGGRHRSVYLAERLTRELRGLKGVTTRVRHRDVTRDVGGDL
jgi:UPF0042 nucleotide-binding protein